MKSSVRNRAGLIGLVASVIVALVASAGLSLAKGNPPGNNGTVKVDGQPFDQGPNNEPHPGCTFEINFFGYDEGNLNATYEFDLQPPSGRGELDSGSVFIGGDPAGGGRDFDGTTGEITLSFPDSATANKNQGYHVKLTVHAEGSIGSDVKHKVFWVQCGNGGIPRSPHHPRHHKSSGAAAATASAPLSGAAAARAATPAKPVKGSPAFTG